MSSPVHTSCLQTKNLNYSYDGKSFVLKNVSFEIESGDFVAITGPSGSGKSTLFYILGALTQKFSGEVCLNGQSFQQFTAYQLAHLRNSQIGFVFQQFYLLPNVTALENVLLPAHYHMNTSTPTSDDIARAYSLLDHLGLKGLENRRPQELSGGQQQRVAIARALLRQPDLILADEPTGNLDSTSAQAVMRILKSLNDHGKTVVIVTHSQDIANQCRKVIHMKDGQIESITTNLSVSNHKALTDDLIISRPRVNDTVPQSHEFSLYNWMRLWFTAVPPALKNIYRKGQKSALTSLGVTIGVAAVLTTISLGTFTKERVLASYQSLGVNNLTFNAWPNWRRPARTHVPAIFQSIEWPSDYYRLTRVFPEILKMSPLLTSWNPTFNYGGRSLDEMTLALGVNAEYFFISQQSILMGRPLHVLDVERSHPVCAIGAVVAQKLFESSPVLGRTLSVITQGGRSDFSCRVIGVLSPQSSQIESFQPDRQIFLPFTYLQKVLDSPWEREIRELRIQVKSDYDPDHLGQNLKGFFKSRYGASGEFQTTSNAKVIAQMNLFLNSFSALLIAVSMISLLVGGVGIHNMMLVNLSERLKEIGLRKAVGASPSQIKSLLLMEAVVLCTLGGALGLLIGFVGYHGLILAASQLLPNVKFEWVLIPWALMATFGALVATAIFSGLIPARRAEQLEVIEALRQE